MRNKRNILSVWALLIPLLFSCGEEFLEVKSDVSIGSPSTVADFQALLDNGPSIMNGGSSCRLSIIGADELNLTEEVWQGLTNVLQRNAYVWADEVYEGEDVDDWNRAYARVLQANLVLDGLAKIDPNAASLDAWNNAAGSALFFRALNFYQIAQLFCKPFDVRTASTDLGIPLRLEADVTLTSKRATVQQTYSQMLEDLRNAAILLPEVPSIKMRPSRLSAYALMARIFLLMEDYEKALKYADNVLMAFDGLYDYNDLAIADQYSFPRDEGETNPEILFYEFFAAPAILAQSRMNVDEELLSLYDEQDKRKQVFFNTHTNGNIIFRGSYTGFSSFFTGITTSETLLIRAECHARLGDLTSALADLNQVRRHRFAPEYFKPYENLNQRDALIQIVRERRKELVFRGLRWQDLRRLNRDSIFAKTITRQFAHRRHELMPNDVKYTWPIPRAVIELSGLEQNPR